MSPPTHVFGLRQKSRSFTLVEMVVVLAIAAILAALCFPAINSVLNSYNLASASQSVLGQLNFARQDALANNRATQVRFYLIADYKGVLVYRAVQAFRETSDPLSTTLTITPITKPYFLPAAMWFTYTAAITAPSTLFTTGTSGAVSTTAAAAVAPFLPPPYGASAYVSFRFRPNGQTDLKTSSLVTISWENAKIIANNLPANFVTLQIDAINGNVRAYQP